MKKLWLLALLFIIPITLIGCQKDVEAIPVDVTIIEETMSFRQIDLHVVMPSDVESESDLLEIANSVVSQYYESHFDTIQTSTYDLTLYAYTSEDTYNQDNADYGMISFMINESMEHPGLTLSNNALIYS